MGQPILAGVMLIFQWRKKITTVEFHVPFNTIPSPDVGREWQKEGEDLLACKYQKGQTLLKVNKLHMSLNAII